MLGTAMARDVGPVNRQPALVLVNPVAGRGRALVAAAELTDALRAAGLPFARVDSRARGHLRDLAAASTGVVLVVGGDGSVHEVLDGLPLRAGAFGPLGVLPAGRGDDFAAGAGLPRDAAGLVAALTGGRHRATDVGHVEITCERGVVTHRFANVVGLGFDAEVAAFAAAGRWLRGRALYLAATLRALWRQRAFAGSVEWQDGAGQFETTNHDGLLMVTTCNGDRYGGGLRIAPGARSDDRLLDVVCVGSRSRRATLRLLRRLLAGTHAADAGVLHRRAAAVVLRPDRPLAVMLDGEPVAARATVLRLSLLGERLLLLGAR
jgi:diacylglycerol kinase (ATP)